MGVGRARSRSPGRRPGPARRTNSGCRAGRNRGWPAPACRAASGPLIARSPSERPCRCSTHRRRPPIRFVIATPTAQHWSGAAPSPPTQHVHRRSTRSRHYTTSRVTPKALALVHDGCPGTAEIWNATGGFFYCLRSVTPMGPPKGALPTMDDVDRPRRRDSQRRHGAQRGRWRGDAVGCRHATPELDALGAELANAVSHA